MKRKLSAFSHFQFPSMVSITLDFQNVSAQSKSRDRGTSVGTRTVRVNRHGTSIFTVSHRRYNNSQDAAGDVCEYSRTRNS